MKDSDFFAAMSQVLPVIKPPACLSAIDATDLLLGNADIEMNNHEAIHGVVAEQDNDACAT
jgi:hypothetical protein